MLAQICCFKNSLPQGAPTSPILSNIVMWKLDSQLQSLAKRSNCQYSRYADDMSFSFTCNERRLPREIVLVKKGRVNPGKILTDLIVKNGFEINAKKTRLCSQNTRMEVTGITVNSFANVPRKYVRQIGSMLHAWEKHGYEAAAVHFNERYDRRHRATETPKSFQHVVHGKLLYLRNVRSISAPVYVKLANRFNSLADREFQLKVSASLSDIQSALDATWVVETSLEVEASNGKIAQGSGFELSNGIFITCSHVVTDNGNPLNNLIAYNPRIKNEFKIEVIKHCTHRDIAICRRVGYVKSDPCFDSANSTESIGDQVTLVGFPGHGLGHSHYVVDSKIARTYTISAVDGFEIGTQIREGNSGGPVLDSNLKVVGMALRGATKSAGMNGCITIGEIRKYIGE